MPIERLLENQSFLPKWHCIDLVFTVAFCSALYTFSRWKCQRAATYVVWTRRARRRAGQAKNIIFSLPSSHVSLSSSGGSFQERRVYFALCACSTTYSSSSGNISVRNRGREEGVASRPLPDNNTEEELLPLSASSKRKPGRRKKRNRATAVSLSLCTV